MLPGSVMTNSKINCGTDISIRVHCYYSKYCVGFAEYTTYILWLSKSTWAVLDIIAILRKGVGAIKLRCVGCQNDELRGSLSIFIDPVHWSSRNNLATRDLYSLRRRRVCLATVCHDFQSRFFQRRKVQQICKLIELYHASSRNDPP